MGGVFCKVAGRNVASRLSLQSPQARHDDRFFSKQPRKRFVLSPISKMTTLYQSKREAGYFLTMPVYFQTYSVTEKLS